MSLAQTVQVAEQDREDAIARELDQEFSDVSIGPEDVAHTSVAPGRYAEGTRFDFDDFDGYSFPKFIANVAGAEAIAHDSGLAARIHFVGRRPDTPAVLAAADALVLPSAWEGMPNVVLEAMATGLPVVASRVEGVEELLGPSADDQVVPFGDDRRLIECLGRLLDDEALSARLGEANRRRVAERFGIEGVVAQYQRLWRELAAR
ncbi:MAG: glycosyltransferase [Planctomycetota bacterium]